MPGAHPQYASYSHPQPQARPQQAHPQSQPQPKSQPKTKAQFAYPNPMGYSAPPTGSQPTPQPQPQSQSYSHPYAGAYPQAQPQPQSKSAPGPGVYGYPAGSSYPPPPGAQFVPGPTPGTHRVPTSESPDRTRSPPPKYHPNALFQFASGPYPVEPSDPSESSDEEDDEDAAGGAAGDSESDSDRSSLAGSDDGNFECLPKQASVKRLISRRSSLVYTEAVTSPNPTIWHKLVIWTCDVQLGKIHGSRATDTIDRRLQQLHTLSQSYTPAQGQAWFLTSIQLVDALLDSNPRFKNTGVEEWTSEQFMALRQLRKHAIDACRSTA